MALVASSGAFHLVSVPADSSPQSSGKVSGVLEYPTLPGSSDTGQNTNIFVQPFQGKERTETRNPAIVHEILFLCADSKACWSNPIASIIRREAQLMECCLPSLTIDAAFIFFRNWFISAPSPSSSTQPSTGECRRDSIAVCRRGPYGGTHKTHPSKGSPNTYGIQSIRYFSILV